MIKVFIFILFFFASSLAPVYSQTGHISWDDIIYKVAVYSPTDEIFSWWGHAALVLEFKNWNFERVFDWGINSHPNESFIQDTLDGLVQYSVTSSLHNPFSYIEEDRDIVVYVLNLDAKAKEDMLLYMENRVLPENRFYEYHEFLDNCSTGVRDVIDLGVNGQLKAAFDGVPGRFTYRQHVQRYTWFRAFADWLMSFLMGQNLDEKISVWDEMFLPVEIARNIVDFKYIDNSGVQRDLVSSVHIINSSKNRPPILNKPLTTWPIFLAAGLFIMTLLFLAFSLKKKAALFSSRCDASGRIFINVIQCILGLFLGFCGCVLVIGLLLDTDYVRQNINILFVNPLLLIIAPLGILSAANKNIFFKSASFAGNALLLKIIWTYVFAAGLITLLLKFLPFFYQQNQSACALILPPAFALSVIPQWIYNFFRGLIQKSRKKLIAARGE